MSTGQFPQRRETDAQAKRRNDKINERIAESVERGNVDYRDKYKPKERKKDNNAVVHSEDEAVSE
jgi:hypothetical protein